MSARLAFALAVAGAFATGCAERGIGVAECAAMPVKGWEELLARPAFAGVSHRKEIVFNPLTETSQLLVADSSFDYDTLVAFVFAHPQVDGKAPSADGARCIRDVSLTVRLPLDAARARTLSDFESFVRAKGVPPPAAARVDAAGESAAAFAPLAAVGAGRLSAGLVESGARGRFFRVEIASPRPGAQSTDRGVAK